ncbi:MAG: hypothetical protein E3J72_03205 [Planctomycetota bacterium]|nr:MAG: hypothetical protein E3J72_03205 [Planctomycetota bacterium]
MPSFSQRHGYEPIKNIIQIDSMNQELKTGLWNCFFKLFWNDPIQSGGGRTKQQYSLGTSLWEDFFKLELDTCPGGGNLFREIKNSFASFSWNRVYDFLEFVIPVFLNSASRDKFINGCNRVLERENSAYRFIGNQITPISDDAEINTIEEGLSISQKGARNHLGRSLELLSDRENPDYRNSIKESISAVESICQIIANDKNATLGKALKVVEDRIPIHGALKSAFDKLYGYTSDENGIRHALLDESTSEFEDAKFMLVSCSAFINYLVAKCAKTGITLDSKPQ